MMASFWSIRNSISLHWSKILKLHSDKVAVLVKRQQKKQPVLKQDTKIMTEQKSVTFNINNKGLTLEIYDPKQLTMNGQLWHFITTSRSIRILFCSSLFWLRRIFCLRVKVIIVCKLSNAIQTVTEHCTASTDRRCKYLNDYVTVQHRSFHGCSSQ